MEIKASDLRIGNYILFSGHFEMVVDVMCDSINTMTGSYLYDDFEGIRLTSEILEKAGFVVMSLRPYDNEQWADDFDFDFTDKGGYNVFYRIGDFILGALREDDKCWALVYENAGYDENAHIYTHVSEITTLHQLQNLYHVLTSTELKIEL